RDRALPQLALSPLGRSYQGVISSLDASGGYVTTGLAAVAGSGTSSDIEDLAALIGRVARSTGRVAIGSDAPAVPIGSGFHEELATLELAGISPSELLRWATAGGAIALGVSQQLGTVEPGRLADLVIVDGDPLRSITALSRIEAVVRDGVWIEPTELSRPIN
ncbi:MAG: amidohydrolase family protein, partial [Gammaproteobacteria bacterium]|nr:amidohydrolase family protein [Gammaproteobacteria bacterium]